MKIQGLMIAALIALVGCASEKQGPPSTSAPATTTCGAAECTTAVTGSTPVGTGTDPATTGYSSGSTVSLQLNGSALGRMFYNSKPVSPTNVRMNLDLTSNSDSVIVSYIENGILHEAAFGTQHPTSSASNAMYNGWVSQNGQNVWKGFFQDAYGAIVLVIDKSLNAGDGTAANVLGGSIWFENFQESNYQNPVQGPLKMCWEITAGPYDCRTFIVGSSVVVTSSLYPNNHGPNKSIGYEKLADFGGLDRTASHL